MDQRIAIDFGLSRLENARAHTLGETEHVDRAHHVRLHSLHRVVLVVDRRGRTRKVVDLIDLKEYRLSDVVTYQLETRIIEQVQDVFAPAGEEVVEAEHFVAFAEEPFAKMRADEPRATCD